MKMQKRAILTTKGSFERRLMKECALGMVFNADQSEILLIQRRDLPVWVLPGGGIETGEKADEAVLREVLEETGLKVCLVQKKAEYLPINRWTRTVHLFECLP